MPMIVRFHDTPGREDLRTAHMSRHLEFIQSNTDKFIGAGPLFLPEGTGAGGMWMLDVETADAARALVQADPFYPTGLRKSIEYWEWRQVFDRTSPR